MARSELVTCGVLAGVRQGRRKRAFRYHLFTAHPTPTNIDPLMHNELVKLFVFDWPPPLCLSAHRSAVVLGAITLPSCTSALPRVHRHPRRRHLRQAFKLRLLLGSMPRRRPSRTRTDLQGKEALEDAGADWRSLQHALHVPRDDHEPRPHQGHNRGQRRNSGDCCASPRCTTWRVLV